MWEKCVSADKGALAHICMYANVTVCGCSHICLYFYVCMLEFHYQVIACEKHATEQIVTKNARNVA